MFGPLGSVVTKRIVQSGIVLNQAPEKRGAPLFLLLIGAVVHVKSEHGISAVTEEDGAIDNLTDEKVNAFNKGCMKFVTQRLGATLASYKPSEG